MEFSGTFNKQTFLLQICILHSLSREARRGEAVLLHSFLVNLISISD